MEETMDFGIFYEIQLDSPRSSIASASTRPFMM